MHLRTVLLIATSLSLAGCLSVPDFMSGNRGYEAETTRAKSFAQTDSQSRSDILESLQSRKSVLEGTLVYPEIAEAALVSSAGVAEASLRSAKLRAEAENKNWLPTIEPVLSLNNLGEVVTGLLLDQVLFDNGLRKADRAYAAADVEVAAVSLSEDVNERVFSAVTLYLTFMRETQKAKVATKAIQNVVPLERIVVGRVRGGVSDRGDQRMVESKVQDIQSRQRTAAESSQIARAELRAMTGQDWELAAQSTEIDVHVGALEALSVVKARAESHRAIAQAKAQRAIALPGLKASGSSVDGELTGNIGVTSEGLGFGTGARLKAIKAAEEAAARQVAEASEKAARRDSRNGQKLISLQRKRQESVTQYGESRELYRLFQAQLKAGQRSVIEVVNAYEDMVLRELDMIDADFDVVFLQMEQARDLGLLVDGDRI